MKSLVTLCLVIFLLYSCDLTLLTCVLLSADLSFAFATFMAMLLLMFLGAINLWLLVNSIHKIPFSMFIYSYSYGFAISLFTPSQLGDASIAFFLKKHGIYYSKSALAYSVDKAISMSSILMIGYFGTTFLYPEQKFVPWIFAFQLLILLIASMAVAILTRFHPKTNTLVGRINQFVCNVHTEFIKWHYKYRLILVNCILTIVKWFVLSAVYYMAFLSFGIRVPWPGIGIIPIVSTLIGYIPISIGGLGTVELCAVYLFSLVSVDKVYVINAYIILRLMTYLQAGLLLALCKWRSKRAPNIASDFNATSEEHLGTPQSEV